MKVSVEWMREYAALDAPVDTLVRALTDTGTEVDSFERAAEGVLVARVAALAPVPESSKGILFADIDVGGGRVVRLLTGAPNLHVGDLVPYAPPGTRLPGWDEPLGVRVMFGKYESPGMLCSAAELQAGDDHEGIMVLEHGTPGTPFWQVARLDTVLEVEVGPNRPDCLSHLGIARELAAALDEPLREPSYDVPAERLSAASAAQRVSVRVDDPAGCPRFSVRIIENVANRPSPAWMQRRLRAVGLRPINAVVDVTNYVATELGQPLHAFDLDKFVREDPGGDGTAGVVVRRGRPGETVACLDGEVREVGPEDLVVCAGERPVSIAGIIGGVSTAVDDGTRAVLLEAAAWHGPSIRASSRRLKVRTDASTRYEKGLSDTMPPLALDRAAGLIADLTDGHVLRDPVDDHSGALPQLEPVETTAGFLESVLGYPVDSSEAATALARLGFAVEQEGAVLRALPPHFRRDVTIPVDIAEEVGRSLGYARVPSTLPGRRAPVVAPAPPVPIEDGVRETCVGAGFDEAITYSFISESLAGLVPGWGGVRRPLRLSNPLSDEMSVLRTSVLAGLCAAVAGNLRHGSQGVALFELGRAFWEGERTQPPFGATRDGADAGLESLPAEPLLLGLAAAVDDAREDDTALRRLQSVLGRIVTDLSGLRLASAPASLAGLRPGRSARLEVAGRPVGIVGDVTAEVLAALGVRGRLAVAELQIDAVLPSVPRDPRFTPPPRHPAVVQDLAVVVDAAIPAADALRAIVEAGSDLLEDVDLYDEFRAERLGAGRKGWTFKLTYRAPDRTLSGDEAQACQERIAAALRERTGAEIRT